MIQHPTTPRDPDLLPTRTQKQQLVIPNSLVCSLSIDSERTAPVFTAEVPTSQIAAMICGFPLATLTAFAFSQQIEPSAGLVATKLSPLESVLLGDRLETIGKQVTNDFEKTFRDLLQYIISFQTQFDKKQSSDVGSAS